MLRRLLPLLVILPIAAGAQPQRPLALSPLSLHVTPSCCSIGFTAYAFGLFPIEGHFAAFEGSLVVDPVTASDARAEARIEAASLSLDGGPIEADVKAEHFLDVDHFRFITFRADGIAIRPSSQSGADAGVSTLRGQLTIKGVTNPVILTIRRNEAWVTAEATISRRAFGITARPVLAGDTIAIRVTAPLPR